MGTNDTDILRAIFIYVISKKGFMQHFMCVFRISRLPKWNKKTSIEELNFFNFLFARFCGLFDDYSFHLFIYEYMIYYNQMISHTVLIPKICVDNWASCTWDMVCQTWNITWILALNDTHLEADYSKNNNAFLLYILNNPNTDILDQMGCHFFVPFYF